MTKERAAKIILDLINAGEAEYINFSVEEIMAFKKAYVALNSEPTTNADRIRSLSDEELAQFWGVEKSFCPPEKTVLSCMMDEHEKTMPTHDDCIRCWLDWLKEEARTND